MQLGSAQIQLMAAVSGFALVIISCKFTVLNYITFELGEESRMVGRDDIFGLSYLKFWIENIFLIKNFKSGMAKNLLMDMDMFIFIHP